MSILSTSARLMRRSVEAALGADGSGAAPLGEPRSCSRGEGARRELLERIAQFVLRHGLAVTGGNLAAICEALSGSDAALAEAIAAREISGDPIDQRWLDQRARPDPEGNRRTIELERLMDQLEASLVRFGQTARSAHLQTSDHRGAIDAQIAAMSEVGRERAQAGEGEESALAEAERVIGLSRAMLDHLGRIEDAMERSRAETEALRENLAAARQEAEIDHLTRLPNRRAFERRLAADHARAAAGGLPLSLALCDIDHFKRVNDSHGHDAGDRVLCMIASLLGALASSDCFAARHGGEEFVLLFYGQPKPAAASRLEDVRAALASKQLVNRETGRPFGRITFSAGIAQVSRDDDPRSALAKADQALYEAKQSGRNRIVLA